MLTFAGHLLETCAGLATLQRFAQDHLLWIPSYCTRLAAAARTSYYCELAEETRLATLTLIGRLVADTEPGSTGGNAIQESEPKPERPSRWSTQPRKAD